MLRILSKQVPVLLFPPEYSIEWRVTDRVVATYLLEGEGGAVPSLLAAHE